jgi:phosphoenolpyruvate---glycerone phosphotransferase subunit DhaL
MTRVGKEELARMAAAAAAKIRERSAWLSELDCATGDGDHGSTMVRCMDRLEKAVGPGGPAELKAVFHEAGWSVLGADGGASSSLLGTFFLGMAEAPAGTGSLDCRELAAAFEAGLAAVRKQSKAQPGDKTMIDALVPAVESFRASADGGRDLVDALQSAAEAAQAGAESTINFIARYGRAKFLGEKTRGHEDPGAASIALLFEGFWRGLATAKGAGNA